MHPPPTHPPPAHRPSAHRPPAHRLHDSVADLLAGARRREPFRPHERRSGSVFERVWFDGDPLVVKYIELDRDFTMRVSGDIGCRAVRGYAEGAYDAAPALIDHAVVAAALGHGRHGWGGALLMRDVSRELVAPGDDPFPEEQHQAFLDHLAGMCARTWGWHDTLGLLPYAARWQWFGRAAIDGERDLGWPEPVPRIAEQGWAAFDRSAPAPVAEAVQELRRDVTPLAGALARTPSCLLHGDWKASNLGTARDGRTVLVDWAYVGEGPAAHELGWYLALNRAKLPAPKERVIDDFHTALLRRGVVTEGWWDRQLGLALLGTLVQFGWEKALGDAQELGWWCERAREGLRWL